MAKEIVIKKFYIKSLFISFIIGFGILYGLQHFGNFKYIANSPINPNDKPSTTSYVSFGTEVSTIQFHTFFDNIIQTRGNGFTVSDMHTSGSEFNSYKTKVYYYTEAVKKEYMYGIIISLALYFLTILFHNFKIKIK